MDVGKLSVSITKAINAQEAAVKENYARTFIHASSPRSSSQHLQGHRDRFLEQFKKLKHLFYHSSNLQYFKRLIQIPQLPENQSNFLQASALSEHISSVVVIPAEALSPDSEPLADFAEMETSSQQNPRLVMQLKGQVCELVAEQKHLKQQALEEGDFLGAELDELKKRHRDTEKAQRSLTEIKNADAAP